MYVFLTSDIFLDNFNPEFVSLRCFELNLFLECVVAHPRLSTQPALRAFLARDDETFAAARAIVDAVSDHLLFFFVRCFFQLLLFFCFAIDAKYDFYLRA